MIFTLKTKRFGMPLLHVVGPTSLYTSFSVCLFFLRNEDTESYKWEQESVAGLYQPTKHHAEPRATHPITIATDRDDTLIAAIDSVFPQSKNLICRWRIANNLLTNCRQHFTADDWDEYIKKWMKVGSCSFVNKFA